MAYLSFDLAPQWAAAARYTSVGNTPMEMVNPWTSLTRLHYVVTDTDTMPGLPVSAAGTILPGGKHSVGLTDGERLWLASSSGPGKATVNY